MDYFFKTVFLIDFSHIILAVSWLRLRKKIKIADWDKTNIYVLVNYIVLIWLHF